MKIRISPEEFADFVVSFIFDKMVNEEEVLPDYEEFNELVETMLNKGMKSFILKYYLNMSSQQRVDYKRIRDAFTTDKQDIFTINILGGRENLEDSEEKNDEKYYIKEVVRKVVKNIRKQRFHTSRPITESDIEKIIERVIEDERGR